MRRRVALVTGAKPLIRPEGVIDGYSVRVPIVDVNAIGAGGGSIAWVAPRWRGQTMSAGNVVLTRVE